MDIERFIEEEQFIQCQPLRVDAFISYCEKRGLSISKMQLEYFEKNKLFFPLLRIKKRKYKEKIVRISENEYKHLGVLTPNERFSGELREAYEPIHFDKNLLSILFKKRYITIPKGKRFVPWATYYDSIIGDESHSTFYSQFQVYWLFKLLQGMKIELAPPGTDHISKKSKYLRDIERYFRSIKRNYKEAVDYYYRITELAISLQNRYLPYTKSDQRSIIVSNPIIFSDWSWHDYKKTWNPEKTRKALNIDPEYLKDHYNRIYLDASNLDPLADWDQIVQFIAYEKKQRLKSHALLAQDFYAMALMVKMFYEDSTKESMPDFRIGANWKVRYYGAETLANKLEYLEHLANEYRVNPRPKLILVVEGDGEFENIPRIAKAMGMDLNKTSIRLENLQGIDNLRKLPHLIDHYHDLQTVVYVLLDNENNMRQFRQKILGMKSSFGAKRMITKSEYVRLWDKNFEFDNFLDLEIAAGMTNQAGAECLFQEQEISKARIGNITLQAIYKNKVGRGLNKKDLASFLSNIIIEEVETAIDQKGLTMKRKIIAEIIKITNIAFSNYFPVRKELWRKNQKSGYYGDVVK
ncbi:MAG: hypothetical protein MIO92_12125 [Methanosarcinaceae archaeon]|nr:hypothetical protein [Methanosarcinaceae archaeon]